MLQTKKRAGSPPAGSYSTILQGVEEVPGSYKNKSAARWSFRVEEGEHKGKVIERVTGIEYREGEAWSDLVDQLAGREIPVEEDFPYTSLIGQRFTVLMVPSGNGAGAVFHSAKPEQK